MKWHYEKIIKDSQANFSFEVRKVRKVKSKGTQGSTYLKKTHFNELFNNEVLIEKTIEIEVYLFMLL